MKYCKRCLYPENHPLYITFDEEGICSGCRVHEEKDTIEWEERGEKLRGILDQYKSRSGNNYDCIIPVSGAQDAHFIVHTVKNVYGMNPLLVSYNKQYNTETGIRNLANIRIAFDCDFMMLTVNPEKVKKITRATLREIGSMYWHCIAGQTVYPVQMAVKLKVPLIIWGAHQGVDQVGMFSHLDEVEMTRKYRKEHDLMGREAEDLINIEMDNLSEKDVFEFVYPDDKEIERVGVRGIYLNNFIRWDSKAQHEQMIKYYGYESAAQTRTFDTYNNVDCFNYSDVHDYIKFLKHGYSKVTDHASREIRLRRMSREQGLRLVQEFYNRQPQNLPLFLEWIGMKENGFKYLVNQHRSSSVWHRNDNWEWELNSDFLKEMEDEADMNAALEQVEEFSPFQLTRTGQDTGSAGKYILLGKGYNEK
jgi:N-acetyl sugar amidotransferase